MSWHLKRMFGRWRKQARKKKFLSHCAMRFCSLVCLSDRPEMKPFFKACSRLDSSSVTMDNSAATEVIEELSDSNFSDESRPTSFRSAGTTVANFSSVLSLISLFLTLLRWSFVIYHKPVAVDWGDKSLLRHRTHKLRKCVENWNDKGVLIVCCFWAIVSGLKR